MTELTFLITRFWRWIEAIRHKYSARQVGLFVIIALLTTSGILSFKEYELSSSKPEMNNKFATAVAPTDDVAISPAGSGCLDPDTSFQDDRLQQLLDDFAVNAGGHYAIVSKDFTTCRYAAVSANERLASASLYKLFVMYAAYAEQRSGRLSFDEKLVVTEESLVEQEDTLILEVGDELTVEEAIRSMVRISDNASSTLLLDRIGVSIVQDWIDQLGLKNTCIECSDFGSMTSASDVAQFFELLAEHKIVDAAADEEMIQMLKEQQINDRLPKQLPDGVVVAHKTGDLDDIRHDAGIVYGPNGAYVIVIMADQLLEPALADDSIAEISREVYDYFANNPVAE